MNSKNRSIKFISLMFVFILLSGCAGQAATSTPAPLPIDTPTSAPVTTGGYQPVSAEVCQILQEDATNALGLTFTMEASTPFTDYVSGESGLGCMLTASTNGASIADPNDALTKLVSGFIGWEEQTAYQAGGPTGAATAMTRDSGLMLISVGWEPSADANCPSDQPIASCELTPEQKIYTVTVQAAQK